MRRRGGAQPAIHELQRTYRTLTPDVLRVADRWLGLWKHSGLNLEKDLLAASPHPARSQSCVMAETRYCSGATLDSAAPCQLCSDGGNRHRRHLLRGGDQLRKDRCDPALAASSDSPRRCARSPTAGTRIRIPRWCWCGVGVGGRCFCKLQVLDPTPIESIRPRPTATPLVARGYLPAASLP